MLYLATGPGPFADQRQGPNDGQTGSGASFGSQTHPGSDIPGVIQYPQTMPAGQTVLGAPIG